MKALRLFSAFVSAASLLIAAQSFAGSPAARACYALSEIHVNEPSLPAKQVPWQICLDQVSYNSASHTLTIASSTDGALFRSLKVERAVREGTGEVFSASSVFAESQAAGCGKAEQFRVLVAGKADAQGGVNANSLKLYVEHALTLDSCYKPAWKKVYQYEVL